jgi:cytochrome P450
MTAQPSPVPLHLRRQGADPDPALQYLREHRPLVRIRLPGGAVAWLATSSEAITAILSEPASFGSNGFRLSDPASSAAGGFSADRDDRHGNITVYDPPDHTRLRAMIAPAFSARRMTAMEPLVRQLAAERLEAMARSGPPADLVRDFALPVPSLVICELLGVPYADRSEFQRRSNERFDCNLPFAVRDEAVRQSRDYMAAIVAQQRSSPGPGIIGMIISQHGADIEDRELAGLADTLLLGGYETTAHMLSLGTWVLLQDQPTWHEVGAGRSLVAVVEELLRFVSVVQNGIPRVALRDVSLYGQQIRAGERILCSLPSGNRDSAARPEPDAFAPGRQAARHLAFGHGIHYCVGAALARLELQVCYQALAERFPRLRPADDGGGPVFRSNSQVHGLESFPVHW